MRTEDRNVSDKLFVAPLLLPRGPKIFQAVDAKRSSSLVFSVGAPQFC